MPLIVGLFDTILYWAVLIGITRYDVAPLIAVNEPVAVPELSFAIILLVEQVTEVIPTIRLPAQ